MLYWFAGYLAVAGGASAGAQVAQGMVRGVARLSHGDARGAVVEAAAGLAAPAVTAVRRFLELGADVCKSVAAISAEGPA